MPSYQRSSLVAGRLRPQAPASIGHGRAMAPRRAAGGRAPSEARVTDTAAVPAERLPLPVFLILVALVVPWILNVGSLRLSPYRLVLIVMFVPCLMQFVAGKAGPVRLPDIAVILYDPRV